MTWLQRYWLQHYATSAIWIAPLGAVAVALAAVRVLHWIEADLGWEAKLNPETARAVLTTLAASMFTFVVFVSSALLVAVQLASAQLTPRIVAIVFKDPVTKLSLTFFVLSFTFTLGALIRIKESVPLLTAQVAAYSCLSSLAVFLFLLDHVGKTLTAGGALRLLGRLGRSVIVHIYPRRLSEIPDSTQTSGTLSAPAARTITSSKDGTVLAFDVCGLVSLARRADCVIQLAPQVGDFIATGDPLFRIHGGGETLTSTELYQSVAIGHERTMEQDPAYVFRIMVDIASKALSPAINDPTSAVLAIDQIHHLLRNVGSRYLDEGQVRDAKGQLRLIYRTPDWEDFVHLAITEIRQFGAQSIQINRRLRAMLENLIQTVPQERAKLLRQELNILRRSAQRFFTEPEDRALADVSDLQGVGGKHGHSQAVGQSQPASSHAAADTPGVDALLAPSQSPPVNGGHHHDR